MAHYVWDEGMPLGKRLRDGLEALRTARHYLTATIGAMSQMTDAQIVSVFGFADTTTAAAAKAELASDVSNLISGDGTGSTNAGRALQQMLDQFS